MPTEAQIAANRQNARRSTGPHTAEGKEAIAQNNFRHGLTGAFNFLRWEKLAEFEDLLVGLRAEHKPLTLTEDLLVERMAQHEWLRRRAHTLQHLCFIDEAFLDPRQERAFALYLRYQTTHERAFHKCLNELLNLRREKRKQEIGFESQKQKQTEEARKQELHKARTHLANAKAAHLELDEMSPRSSAKRRPNADAKGTIEAATPGHTAIPFHEMKPVLKTAIEEDFGSHPVVNAA